MSAPPLIRPAGSADREAWARMRRDLWPHHSIEEHFADIDLALERTEPGSICLMARLEDRACGFAEISLRHDYVNGCKTSPVTFLEGIYVTPDARGQGVARALVAAAETWARECGCTEFASDALIENAASAAMHVALGFEETQRVVYFRKALPSRP